MSNIVLIGIMGCGKSTVGKALAKALQYQFIDADDYLVDKYQMSIPDMFAISEDYFRDRESACLDDFVSKDHSVIAMGGGVIKRAENHPKLKKSVRLFIWIGRSKISLMMSIPLVVLY